MVRKLSKLDIEFARSHFSALASDWAFFENAGGTLAVNSVLERTRAYMENNIVQPVDIYLVHMGQRVIHTAARIANDLRKNCGKTVVFETLRRSLKSQMREAGRCSAATTLILGEEEFAENKIIIKDMATGNQKNIPLSEIIQFFKLDQSDYRIYPVGHLFGESRFAAFQIESIGGYHPAKLRAYNDFLSQTGNGASIPVLQMMNAKYLISTEPLNHPDLIATKTGRLKSSRGELDAHVYRVKDALPRVWFVNELKSVPENEVFKQTTLQAFNPSQTALVSQDMTQPSGEPAQITKMDRGIHHTAIHTESEGNQFLVLSEVYYPLRWKAMMDGEEIQTHKVNGILRGVEVPAGNHTIDFIYDKSSFKKGLTISFTSFGLSLGLIGFGYLRRKKDE